MRVRGQKVTKVVVKSTVRAVEIRYMGQAARGAPYALAYAQRGPGKVREALDLINSTLDPEPPRG